MIIEESKAESKRISLMAERSQLPLMEQPEFTEEEFEHRCPVGPDSNNLVDCVAVAITQGTSLPYAFARETLKMMLLAGVPSLPRVPNMGYLHSRQYVILLSDEGGVGKGETWRRCSETLRKADFYNAFNYRWINGGVGSPEYAVERFGGVKEKPESAGTAPNIPVQITGNTHRNVVHYDEGKALAQKDSKTGSSGLVSMYTQLFDSNEYSAGSRGAGLWVVKTANVSMMMHFVKDAFDLTLPGVA